MFWHGCHLLLQLLFDFIQVKQLSSEDKDLAILLLRQQLMLVRQKQKRGPTLTLFERLHHQQGQLREALQRMVLLFQPEMILNWQRALIRRKWAWKFRHARGGRPRIIPELEALVIRLAQENPWGAGRIAGELRKLGYRITERTILNILKRHSIPTQPTRQPRSRWKTFLNHHRRHLLAVDFFTVETFWLQTLYVLFFIAMGTRRVHLAGITAHPNHQWVTQQVRQLVWKLKEENIAMHYLIHDRDSKFTSGFDRVFTSEGIDIIETPVRAPNANAYAERWVRSIREECLDRVLILNQRHLHTVLQTYAMYYNYCRPHQGLDQQMPIPMPPTSCSGTVQRQDLLDGILKNYSRAA